MAKTPLATASRGVKATPRRNDRGRTALAPGPTGVIVALFGVSEVGLGVATRSPNLPPETATVLVIAMTLLAFVALLGFLYAWLLGPPGKIYSPVVFEDQAMWERSVRMQDFVSSRPLSLDRLAISLSAMTEQNAGRAFLANEIPALQHGSPSSTGIMELSRCLREETGWDFLLVDVGEGDRWLLSRLFGFIVIFRTQRSLPCVVFVRTEESCQRLLGIADPTRLCETLATKYPWFNEKLAAVLLTNNVPVFGSAPLDERTAIKVLTELIKSMQEQENHAGDPEWTRLSSTGTWEHTRWLNEATLRGELRAVLLDTGQSRLRRPGGAAMDQATMFDILGRDTRFVAAVDMNDTFIRLFDKREAFERMKDRLSEAPPAAAA